MSVQVETKIPGGWLGAPEHLVLEFALEEAIDVAGLIRLKVEEEASRLAAMQTLDGEASPPRLGREYRDLQASGELAPAQLPLDIDAEVRSAQRAFAAGRFLILVDGQRYTRLDEPVALGPHSTVKFVRLMPLTGG